MASKVMVLFEIMFEWIIYYFGKVMAASGMAGIWLGIVFMTLCYKFLLAPLFGRSGAGSDRAKRSKEEE